MSNINKTIISQGSVINPHHTDHTLYGHQIQDHTTSLKQSVLQSYQHEKYSHINNLSLLKVFFFQLFGTIFFVGLAVAAKAQQWADVCIGMGILVGVIISGPVSGGNMNPGVTLCTCLKKQNKFRWKMLPLYLLAQFLGVMIALVYSQLIDDLKVVPLMPADPNSVASCFRVAASQAIGSFILIFFILQISNPNTTFIDNELSGYMFIVLFVHTARKYAASSHQCINSMIAFCFALVSAIQTGDSKGLVYSLLWFGGDIIGMLVALIFYQRMFQGNVQYERKIKREQQQKNFMSLLQNNQEQDNYQVSIKKGGKVLKVQKNQEFQV